MKRCFDVRDGSVAAHDEMVRLDLDSAKSLVSKIRCYRLRLARRWIEHCGELRWSQPLVKCDVTWRILSRYELLRTTTITHVQPDDDVQRLCVRELIGGRITTHGEVSSRNRTRRGSGPASRGLLRGRGRARRSGGHCRTPRGQRRGRGGGARRGRS